VHRRHCVVDMNERHCHFPPRVEGLPDATTGAKVGTPDEPLTDASYDPSSASVHRHSRGSSRESLGVCLCWLRVRAEGLQRPLRHHPPPPAPVGPRVHQQGGPRTRQHPR